jgi:thiol-disulfide isomerase/thioredoxin
MSFRLSRATLLRLALLVVVAVSGVLVALRTSPQAAPAGTVSTQRTSWQLPRLGGGSQVTLAGFHGRPLVVDFFASWCTACRGELPGFASVSSRLKGQVAFVGVNSEETGDGLAMARQYGIDWWALAVDSGGSQASGLHDDLGAPGMPVTAFYDADGKVLLVLTGAISEDDLKARLHTLYGVVAT